MRWQFKFGCLRVLWLRALHFLSHLPCMGVCRLSFQGGHKEQRWLLGNLRLATKDEVHGDCQLPSVGCICTLQRKPNLHHADMLHDECAFSIPHPLRWPLGADQEVYPMNQTARGHTIIRRAWLSLRSYPPPQSCTCAFQTQFAAAV
ncbi:uncharacterized protein LOC119278763 [Triticum dicoccoides]|uniref:uncharacterized protein LOC119278763 n=1 Tax=Triticum dicoccoides TaxID=85692 RepID=UPI00188EB52E|nr:uncharacterized protein LOC119278763 [Triticum dicoccoides]